MINYLDNRAGVMTDDTLAMRVMEELQAVGYDDWASDDVWTAVEETDTSGFDVNAFGGLYASDGLLHISLYRYVLRPDGYFRVGSYDNPLGTATMTMDSMKELFGVSLRLDENF